MPRLQIRNFSGGLVTNQSDFDISESQYTKFTKVLNKKPGRLERPNGEQIVSSSSSGSDVQTELTLYRTEKDGSNADISTTWWVYGSGVLLRRQDTSTGTGGSFSNITTGWSSSPLYDFLVHNQVLRISDGSFSNDTKWYGHIKRNVFGKTDESSYTTGYAFKKPPMQALVNDWKITDAQLTPPTVVRMSYSWDQDGEINTANEVGLYITFPDGASDVDEVLISDLADVTFKTHDRYTVTFIYDYVQESALGKESNGNIGIESRKLIADASVPGKTCPGIQVVLHTGSSLADLNPRITGINIYWNPEDDVDWYLIDTIDIDNGFRDSPLSEYSNQDAGSDNPNNGRWIPCPEPYVAQNSFVNVSSENTETSSITLSSTPSNFAVDKMIFIYPSHSLSTIGQVKPIMSDTCLRIGNIKSISSEVPNQLTTGYSTTSITMVNTRNESSSAFNISNGRAYVASTSTTKVATWWIPFDGLKLATYNSLTGRASSTTLNEIKWNTATILNNKAYYANIDTTDENGQTARERNQIYYTDPYKLDEIIPTRYFDVGRNDGDEIIKITAYRNKIFVFKTRNTYVLNEKHQIERVFTGVGAVHKNAVCETPMGLVCANKQSIHVVNNTSVRELTFNIKDTYQALTLDRPALGYDGIDNELIFLPDNDAPTTYIMNMDNGSWIERELVASANRSNLIINESLRSQYTHYFAGESSTFVRVQEINTGSLYNSTATVRTKRFDFNSPDTQKRLSKVTIVYKASSALTVKVYADTNFLSGSSADATLTFGTQTYLKSVSKSFSVVGKTATIEFSCAASNLEIDSIDIDYALLGSNP